MWTRSRAARRGAPVSAASADRPWTGSDMPARLREHYQKKVIPALTKEHGYKNVMAVPKLEKISINIGLGEATQNAKLMEDRKSTRLNSSHGYISYAVFCLKKTDLHEIRYRPGRQAKTPPLPAATLAQL